MSTKDLIEAVLKRLTLLNTHENVNLVKVRAGTNDLLQNNLSEVASGARNEDILARVKALHFKRRLSKLC